MIGVTLRAFTCRRPSSTTKTGRRGLLSEERRERGTSHQYSQGVELVYGVVTGTIDGPHET